MRLFFLPSFLVVLRELRLKNARRPVIFRNFSSRLDPFSLSLFLSIYAPLRILSPCYTLAATRNPQLRNLSLDFAPLFLQRQTLETRGGKNPRAWRKNVGRLPVMALLSYSLWLLPGWLVGSLLLLACPAVYDRQDYIFRLSLSLSLSIYPLPTGILKGNFRGTVDKLKEMMGNNPQILPNLKIHRKSMKIETFSKFPQLNSI